jgi:hypothetical protein
VYNAVCLGAENRFLNPKGNHGLFYQKALGFIAVGSAQNCAGSGLLFCPPGRRTTFRETCGARAVPFGIVLNVNRLGAFTLLVIVAQTTGMRLFAFLTEFRSHLTPLSLDFEDPFELIRSVVKVCKAETTIRQQAFTVSA